MRLRCPACKKDAVPIWGFFLSSGRLGFFVSCDACSSEVRLRKKATTIITLVTGAGWVLIFALYFSIFKFSTPGCWLTIALAVAWACAVRYFALTKYEVLEECEALPDDEGESSSKTKIKLTGLSDELRRLKTDKKAQFSIIYEPKGHAYLSLYCRSGDFVVELAFATKALGGYADKFKQAVASARATAQEFDTNGMRGFEVYLGKDLDIAAEKARAIFTKVFEVSGDADIDVVRE